MAAVVTADDRADLGNGSGSSGSGSSDDVGGCVDGVGGADRDSSGDADECL